MAHWKYQPWWQAAGSTPLRVAPLAPVFVMVLAATAVPIELRTPAIPSWPTHLDPVDFLQNVAGYVPVGLVLAGLGPLIGVAVAAAASTFAEAIQLAMAHRDPSIIDVAANALGALFGVALAGRTGIQRATVPLGRWTGLVMAMSALVLVGKVWLSKGDPLNPRGASTPGGLEAQWSFDEDVAGGRVVPDSSGHALDGSVRAGVGRVPGMFGSALTLSGEADAVEVRHNSVLRLSGSMTISAWIRSRSYPYDDAAIVSQLESEQGYQLDTTIDTGPRTVGFKLTNARGELIGRYGKTRLEPGVWYHVAGVYDANASTLDVYLNGKNDNGFLMGTVTPQQKSSRGNLYLGRRCDLRGFGFLGSLDDVRIYSAALTGPEISRVMRGEHLGPIAHGDAGSRRSPVAAATTAPRNTLITESYDKGLPGVAAVLGVLSALACAALRSSVNPALLASSSLAAGLLPLPAVASELPPIDLVILPLLSLLGGASALLSIRRTRFRDD